MYWRKQHASFFYSLFEIVNYKAAYNWGWSTVFPRWFWYSRCHDLRIRYYILFRNAIFWQFNLWILITGSLTCVPKCYDPPRVDPTLCVHTFFVSLTYFFKPTTYDTFVCVLSKRHLNDFTLNNELVAKFFTIIANIIMVFSIIRLGLVWLD